MSRVFTKVSADSHFSNTSKYPSLAAKSLAATTSHLYSCLLPQKWAEKQLLATAYEKSSSGNRLVKNLWIMKFYAIENYSDDSTFQ
jgi:hypothetical protein